MIYVYYIGGPWDLHKTCVEQEPRNSNLIVREPYKYRPGGDDLPIAMKEHIYFVRKLKERLFVAIHQEDI